MIKKLYIPASMGHTDPFGAPLYNTVNKNICNIARRYWYMLTDEDVEDLIHNSYETVLSHRDEIDPTRNLYGYVYKICLNTVRSYIIKKGRVRPQVHLDKAFGDEDAPALDHSAIIADNTEADRAIICREFEEKFWHCLELLTPEQRKIAQMLMAGTPYSEMAEELHCSENAARTKVCRTRQALFRLGIAA